jgi:hypothetical protein
VYGLAGEFQLDVRIDGITYPVSEGRVRRLRFHEMSTYMAPMAELFLDDRGNFLTEVLPLRGVNTVEIGIGDSKDELIYTTFRVFRAVVMRHGSDSHLVHLYLVSADCEKMFTPARYKSYASTKISAVVESIAEELGLEAEIEETDAAYDIFCPGFTYAQFLRWLADRARSKKYNTAGYDYFVGYGEDRPVLRFLSQERMKNSTPVIDVIQKNLINDDQYRETDVDQGPYRVYQNPVLMGVQGGYGITSTYFDFEDNVFVAQPISVDGSSSVDAPTTPGFTSFSRPAVSGTRFQGLTDNIIMSKGDVDPRNVVIWGGLAVDAQTKAWNKNVAEAQLLRTLGSMVKNEVLIKGDLRARAGSTITMQIRSPLPENIFNQAMSGKWVVERVTHQLIPQITTKMLVYRSGVGGSDDVNLLVPPGGVIGE